MLMPHPYFSVVELWLTDTALKLLIVVLVSEWNRLHYLVNSEASGFS